MQGRSLQERQGSKQRKMQHEETGRKKFQENKIYFSESEENVTHMKTEQNAL